MSIVMVTNFLLEIKTAVGRLLSQVCTESLWIYFCIKDVILISHICKTFIH